VLDHTARSPLLAIAALFLLGGGLAAGVSCTGADGDGDADGDADADGDGDGDADGDGDSDPGGPLRVVTWNLETFPLASSTIETVARLVVDMEADVVAVQELDQLPAFDELVAALPPSWDGVYADDDPEAFLRVGLLWNADRVELVGNRTLFRSDWYAFPRPPLMALLRVPGPGGEPAFDFTIVVVHQKARMDEESEERRVAGCERLEEWMAEQVATGGDEDIVVLGDWNDDVADRPSDNVFGAFLDRPESYTFLTLDLARAGEHTYLPFESFIDHVLVTASALDEYGAGGRTEVLDLTRTVSRYESLVSDHLPVMVTFDL
jgi:endonuclease/exonuclease/phosphatase family metal-dependent hydrolase